LESKKNLTTLRLAVWAISAAAPSLAARATDLSYTFLDFESLDNTVEKTATQSPFPGETVQIQTSGGRGIAAAGSYLFGERFYFSGYYKSSVIDYSGVVTSAIATDHASGTFDLVASNLSLGYLHKFGDPWTSPRTSASNLPSTTSARSPARTSTSRIQASAPVSGCAGTRVSRSSYSSPAITRP